MPGAHEIKPPPTLAESIVPLLHTDVGTPLLVVAYAVTLPGQLVVSALLVAVVGALLYARVRRVPPSPEPAAAAAPAATPSAQVAPGYLSVGSTPWALVYLDGDSVGATPLQAVPVRPGRHELRLMRDGYESVAQQIEIASGTKQTIANVTLKRVR